MVVIAAVDRSDRASIVVNEAESLAKRFEESVHIVHVAKRSEFLDSAFPNEQVEQQSEMVTEGREAAVEKADEIAGNLEDPETPYDVVGLLGKPAHKIVEYAAEQDARYIVVSPRKRSRTGKVLFGSTAQSILLNATCPVVSTISENSETT
ncbi:UspA domain-containing protein [Natrialba chahannaoensis JCM 10990]|uniref:UspA domain-containing protein n=1 Tax=Natrialba chahannaoensis JCM 10990 TaxID=1227492 RepID=M0B2A8_9EURY|nr:universal stress protein [Natrialba chahannaoensis]ELZ04920.1 UspA domain-containing protein [Natrialba chahannaoensis JCM 10990]